MRATTTTVDEVTNDAMTEQEPEGGELYLACTLRGRSYLAPAALVREVSVVGALTPVPRTPTWFAGVMNLRGAIVGVIELARLLGLPDQAAPRAMALVCAHDDAPIAVAVDAVGGMRWLASGELLPATDLDGVPAPRVVAGYYQTAEGPVGVLDLAWLLGSLDLSQERIGEQ